MLSYAYPRLGIDFSTYDSFFYTCCKSSTRAVYQSFTPNIVTGGNYILDTIMKDVNKANEIIVFYQHVCVNNI